MTAMAAVPNTLPKTKPRTDATFTLAELREQAKALRLHGLLAHWGEITTDPDSQRRVHQWLQWELAERADRSLERRLRDAHLGQFKPLADFDWSWPEEIDRAAIEELMGLQFLEDATNVVLVGPNGVGKSMCAANLGYQAVLAGHTVLFTTAGQMLSELAALDSDSALRRRLQRYAVPDVLLIDSCGVLGNVELATEALGAADDLFNITIVRRGRTLNGSHRSRRPPCLSSCSPGITRAMRLPCTATTSARSRTGWFRLVMDLSLLTVMSAVYVRRLSQQADSLVHKFRVSMWIACSRQCLATLCSLPPSGPSCAVLLRMADSCWKSMLGLMGPYLLPTRSSLPPSEAWPHPPSPSI